MVKGGGQELESCKPLNNGGDSRVVECLPQGVPDAFDKIGEEVLKLQLLPAITALTNLNWFTR